MSLPKNKILAIALGATALLALGAYVGLAYIIEPAVQDSGGGHAESASYQVDCSIGGPVLTPGPATGQTAESVSYSVELGTATLVRGDPPAPPTGTDDGGGCAPGNAGLPGLITLMIGLPLACRRYRRSRTAATERAARPTATAT